MEKGPCLDRKRTAWQNPVLSCSAILPCLSIFAQLTVPTEEGMAKRRPGSEKELRNAFPCPLVPKDAIFVLGKRATGSVVLRSSSSLSLRMWRTFIVPGHLIIRKQKVLRHLWGRPSASSRPRRKAGPETIGSFVNLTGWAKTEG